MKFNWLVRIFDRVVEHVSKAKTPRPRKKEWLINLSDAWVVGWCGVVWEGRLLEFYQPFVVKTSMIDLQMKQVNSASVVASHVKNTLRWKFSSIWKILKCTKREEGPVMEKGSPKKGKLMSDTWIFGLGAVAPARGQGDKGARGGGPHNSSKFDEKIGEGVGIHLRCEKS